MLSIDVFWSFRSPWSYLATPRLRRWSETYELQVHLRPVYPIAVRDPEFFSRAEPQWSSYFMTDVFRVAEFLNLPFRWPRPDPIVSIPNPEGRPTFPAEQPYIHRLTRAGVLAEELGRGIQFADQVSALIWQGQQDWHLGDHLDLASSAAGLDLGEIDARISAETTRLDAAIDANQDALSAAGHWGVPTCVFNGEPFFGQDRLDVLLWRLQNAGLRERTG